VRPYPFSRSIHFPQVDNRCGSKEPVRSCRLSEPGATTQHPLESLAWHDVLSVPSVALHIGTSTRTLQGYIGNNPRKARELSELDRPRRSSPSFPTLFFELGKRETSARQTITCGYSYNDIIHRGSEQVYVLGLLVACRSTGDRKTAS
jgi:hypothetical protein